MHRGAIHQNDRGPSVTVSPGSSLSTTDFRCRIVISLMQKTARGRLRHQSLGTSWDRANPDREVVDERRVVVKAEATGMQ